MTTMTATCEFSNLTDAGISSGIVAANRLRSESQKAIVKTGVLGPGTSSQSASYMWNQTSESLYD